MVAEFLPIVNQLIRFPLYSESTASDGFNPLQQVSDMVTPRPVLLIIHRLTFAPKVVLCIHFHDLLGIDGIDPVDIHG
jgi:hypothetical protein